MEDDLNDIRAGQQAVRGGLCVDDQGSIAGHAPVSGNARRFGALSKREPDHDDLRRRRLTAFFFAAFLSLLIARATCFYLFQKVVGIAKIVFIRQSDVGTNRTSRGAY